MSLFTEMIGYSAAFFGSILMLPQVYKSYKTKQVNDLSKAMLIVYVINCFLWEFYGLLIHSNPVIVCNFLTLLIGIFQVILKFKYQVKQKQNI